MGSEYAKINSKKFARQDTLGNNSRLTDHYTIAGLNFPVKFNIKNTAELPAHYHKVPDCLFEFAL